MSSVWKGHLTFSCVSIPVKLFAAVRSETISLNQLHAKCHTQLKQTMVCPSCSTPVDRSDIVKGYKGKPVNEASIEACKPESSRNLEVREFVPENQVDPALLNTSYYIVPEDVGRKAYALFVQAMLQRMAVAVCRITMHQREHLCVIRSSNGALILHTLYYSDEVRSVDCPPIESEVSAAELVAGTALIEAFSTDFDHTKYSNSYRDKLSKLLMGLTPEEVKSEAPPVIPDLMAALKQSILSKRPPLAIDAAVYV